MESQEKRPARPKVWFVLSDQIPDDELVVPIVTEHGTAMVVRPGEITPQFVKALNRSVDHLISVGLWPPSDDGTEPPRKE
ncbi:hypothetical protein IQ61_18900 [Streptomyces scabiei]|nr:hypothetical protein IQ61_18900 [Streptomyces scabiei]